MPWKPNDRVVFMTGDSDDADLREHDGDVGTVIAVGDNLITVLPDRRGFDPIDCDPYAVESIRDVAARLPSYRREIEPPDRRERRS